MHDLILSFEAIGTKWVIDCWGSPLSKDYLTKILKARIEIFDKTYSRFRKDSLVWEMSETRGVYKLPKDSKILFDLYEKLYQITDGSFTLLIGNTLNEAGYDSDYSFIPSKLSIVPKPSEIYNFNYPQLNIKKPFVLDFGGIGKGYLIDLISDLLIENMVKSFIVEGGGDMKCHNLSKSVKVGLENPINEKQVIGKIDINDKCICSSSGNRRRWANYNHIIDANRLASPDKILATWVIADSAVIADAMSTCLFLTPIDNLQRNFNFDYLILYPDFSIKKSNNFNAELFQKL